MVKWNFFLDTGFDFLTVVERINPYLMVITFYSLLYLIFYYPRQERPAKTATLLEKVQFEIIQHRTLPLVMSIFTGLFLVAHFAAWNFQNNPDLKWSLLFFANEFNLDNEKVLPAYYSGMLLLTAAGGIGIIFAHQLRRKGAYLFQWALLSLIFIFMAADEVLQIHEFWSFPALNFSDFYFSWVPVALLLIALIGLLYFKFFFSLPNRSKLLFFIAAGLYLGGALGMEMVSGNYMATFNEWGFDYWRLVAVEETLEMAGVTFFVFALQDLIQRIHQNPGYLNTQY